MNTYIALSEFASCRTRRVRAKLFRRVHRLWCTVLHTHSMPWTVAFFKPPPQFHRLVGSYLMKILLEKNEKFLTIECQFTKRWRQKPDGERFLRARNGRFPSFAPNSSY